MAHPILLQNLVNHLIAEMSTVICDQCSRSSESREYVAAETFSHYLGIISVGRNCFNPLRDIIYCQQDVQVVIRWGKWSHEIHPP